MLSFRHKAGLSLYRGCGYGLQSLIPDCDARQQETSVLCFSEYNIYLCLVGLQSQNSSLNLCQLKRGTTAWDTPLLLREWIHSCLYDIQRGIGSRWDNEWQNLQHSRIIDITVLATSPEWDVSVTQRRVYSWDRDGVWTEASEEHTQSLQLYSRDPMNPI